jgi:hypothetical protein
MHCVGRTWDVLNLVVHIITTGPKKGYCIHIDILLVEITGVEWASIIRETKAKLKGP